MPHEIKTIGGSGQISLGKEHAGKTVVVDQPEPGVWIVRTAQVIPDNELWLHTPATRRSLDRALEWSQRNPRAESKLPALKKKLARGR
jgi:hypothetical protein